MNRFNQSQTSYTTDHSAAFMKQDRVHQESQLYRTLEDAEARSKTPLGTLEDEIHTKNHCRKSMMHERTSVAHLITV